MKPQYKTPAWLYDRWLTTDLLTWTPTDIAQREQEVNQVIAINQRIHQSAKESYDQSRTNFRATYPHKSWPSYLKGGVLQPPDLLARWKQLINRRERELRRIDEAKEERREQFLGQMSEGRYHAMARRERGIRQLINVIAKERKITLTERAIDGRLLELLVGLGVMPLTGEQHES